MRLTQSLHSLSRQSDWNNNDPELHDQNISSLYASTSEPCLSSVPAHENTPPPPALSSVPSSIISYKWFYSALSLTNRDDEALGSLTTSLSDSVCWKALPKAATARRNTIDTPDSVSRKNASLYLSVEGLTIPTSSSSSSADLPLSLSIHTPAHKNCHRHHHNQDSDDVDKDDDEQRPTCSRYLVDNNGDNESIRRSLSLPDLRLTLSDLWLWEGVAIRVGTSAENQLPWDDTSPQSQIVESNVYDHQDDFAVESEITVPNSDLERVAEVESSVDGSEYYMSPENRLQLPPSSQISRNQSAALSLPPDQLSFPSSARQSRATVRVGQPERLVVTSDRNRTQHDSNDTDSVLSENQAQRTEDESAQSSSDPTPQSRRRRYRPTQTQSLQTRLGTGTAGNSSTQDSPPVFYGPAFPGIPFYHLQFHPIVVQPQFETRPNPHQLPIIPFFPRQLLQDIRSFGGRTVSPISLRDGATQQLQIQRPIVHFSPQTLHPQANQNQYRPVPPPSPQERYFVATPPISPPLPNIPRYMRVGIEYMRNPELGSVPVRPPSAMSSSGNRSSSSSTQRSQNGFVRRSHSDVF